MTATTVAASTAAAWDRVLADAARGRDLHDPEDRSGFRLAVRQAARITRVDLLRDLAAHYGRPVAGNSTRSEALRAMTGAYIAALTATAERTAGARS